ncbi:hypothetical protein DPMN_184396 [Dreissena polymorpha]|uniref:Uncharacterized protein n=1 Tax=Dreissena polymorpha TaxID=45954 RepID=A0A9D4DJG5_DREPO|nr:hypothetical protein DPMN_184396 [Dreissena polymorpha]
MILPSFLKLMKVCLVCIGGFFLCITSRLAAHSLRNLLCRHRYFPPVSYVLQEDRMCSGFAGLPHNLLAGSSVSFQVRRFVGVVKRRKQKLVEIQAE